MSLAFKTKEKKIPKKTKRSETLDSKHSELLKDIYDIDFKIEDVKFEWDGTL